MIRSCASSLKWLAPVQKPRGPVLEVNVVGLVVTT